MRLQVVYYRTASVAARYCSWHVVLYINKVTNTTVPMSGVVSNIRETGLQCYLMAQQCVNCLVKT